MPPTLSVRGNRINAFAPSQAQINFLPATVDASDNPITMTELPTWLTQTPNFYW